jgi:hypothetical protein
MMHRRVEVGVISDARRQQQLGIGHRDENPLTEPPLTTIRRRIGGEQGTDLAPEGRPVVAAQCHQPVEGRRGACVRGMLRRPGESRELVGSGEVENSIADGHPYRRWVATVRAAEYAEWKILDRKVGLSPGRFHPGCTCRIVSFVHAWETLGERS